MDMRRFVPILGVKIKLVAIDSQHGRHTVASLYIVMNPVTTFGSFPAREKAGSQCSLEPLAQAGKIGPSSLKLKTK